MTTGATFLQISLFFRPFFHPFSPGVHQFGPLRFAWSERIVKLSCSGGQQAISRTVGPCEPGQAGNRAALSIVFPGVSGGSLLDPGFFVGTETAVGPLPHKNLPSLQHGGLADTILTLPLREDVLSSPHSHRQEISFTPPLRFEPDFGLRVFFANCFRLILSRKR